MITASVSAAILWYYVNNQRYVSMTNSLSYKILSIISLFSSPAEQQ